MQYLKNVWVDFAEIHKHYDPVGKEGLIKLLWHNLHSCDLINCSLGSLMLYLKNAWMDFVEIHKYLDPLDKDERIRFWQCWDVI